MRLFAAKQAITSSTAPIVSVRDIRQSVAFALPQPLRGAGHELGVGTEGELVLDVLAVCFDGLDADAELAGHFTRRQPEAGQSEHLQLPVRQMLREAAGRATVAGVAVEQV